jgi:hypothetical protein
MFLNMPLGKIVLQLANLVFQHGWYIEECQGITGNETNKSK